MEKAGAKARAAALRSAERTGAEQVAALSGLCTFLLVFFAAGFFAPAALTSFWVWVVMICTAIAVGSGVYGAFAHRP